MCDRWKSFAAFFEDMGPRPSKKHSLDRIDNDGNYEPGNCRWATGTQQASNKRSSKKVILDGEEVSIMELSRRSGILYPTLLYRLGHGWSVKDAISLGIHVRNHYWNSRRKPRSFTAT